MNDYHSRPRLRCWRSVRGSPTSGAGAGAGHTWPRSGRRDHRARRFRRSCRLFFEDINFAADGGLYPEKVKNRSFEFPEALMAWKKSANADAQGEFAVRTDRPASPANPHYVRITSRAGSYGITNDGFRAVSVEAGKRYLVTMLARRVAGTAGLTVGIENARLEEAGAATIGSVPAEWGIVTATITPPVTNTRARFRVRLDGPGPSTSHGVADAADTGGRPTACGRLVHSSPSSSRLLRFPAAHRRRALFETATREETIGGRRIARRSKPLELRVRHASADYSIVGRLYGTSASEDIGAEPLPILNCGRAGQSTQRVVDRRLDQYVKDARPDRVRHGPVNSGWASGAPRWGSRRRST